MPSCWVSCPCSCLRNYKRKKVKMKKILFVCLGNICRSPMAEFVMKRLVSEAGMAEEFEIASAATSTEELGILICNFHY